MHDAACGACAGVARDLPALLRVPVRVRSCRDPELHEAHPDLPGATRACRTPAIGLVAAGRCGPLAPGPACGTGAAPGAPAAVAAPAWRCGFS